MDARLGRPGTDGLLFLSGEDPESVEDGLARWSSLEFQSKPRPMQVTPQLLPTLAALESTGGPGASRSSSSRAKPKADSASIKGTNGENRKIKRPNV